MEQEVVLSILKKIANVSIEVSQIFVDTCNPVFSDVDFGPFFGHFNWGLNKEDIPSFFNPTGWKVSCFNPDDYAQGRFVGSGLMIFIHGERVIKSSVI